MLSSVGLFAQKQCCDKNYINELGLVFPTDASSVKNFINANNVGVSPLTSGFSSGFQLGIHRIVNERATLGLVLGTNAFFSLDSVNNHIYQVGAFITGRVYFGDTWRNGLFAEIAAGPEFAAASLGGKDFQIQTNVASRIGIGYNYQFNKDVTLGVSVVASPSLLANSYFDGSRIVINMLW
jgi:hypothetical protein